MAEIILERWTTNPTGRPEDTRAVEIVLQDDDTRPVTDQTPRTTRIVRIVLRGDASTLKQKSRDVLVTTGRGAARRVVGAARFSASETAAVTLPSLTLQWPLQRGWGQSWDYRVGESRGVSMPVADERLSVYLAKGPR